MGNITDFLVQMLGRLFAETPSFFKTLRTIGVILAVITGIPAYIADAGVVLPEAIATIASKVVMYASLAGAFIAQLTATKAGKDSYEIPHE